MLFRLSFTLILPPMQLPVLYILQNKVSMIITQLRESSQEAVPGTIGLGGYGAPEIAGGEFFFPLADCPAITGVYPIFGKIVNGMEELRRLEQLETYPVPYPGEPNVKINTPVYPVFIEQIQIETFGVSYGEPTRLTGIAKPLFWPCVSP